MADFNLPNEIWCMIFSYLPLAPKKNATATCKLWSRLIREDRKLSGYILINWFKLEVALKTLQWKWSNWPALKTLELNTCELLEDSRKSVQNVIEKLLKYHCPPSLEAVLFKVDLTPLLQTKCQYPLRYQPFTNQIFGFGQELDSIQKWIDYESNIRALKKLKSVEYAAGATMGPGEPFERILAKLGFRPLKGSTRLPSVPSNDHCLLLIASPEFQNFRRHFDGSYSDQRPYLEPELVQLMDVDKFLDHADNR